MAKNSPKRLKRQPVPLEDGTIQLLLTKEQVSVIDEIDAELAVSNWCASHSPTTYYVLRHVPDGHGVIALHRVILARMLGRELLPTEFVDHIDGNGLNNRRSNLRLATKSQNMMNQGARKDNTSGYKGVRWDKERKKWLAQIRINGVNKHLGRFSSKEEAYHAYCEAAKHYHGDFANPG